VTSIGPTASDNRGRIRLASVSALVVIVATILLLSTPKQAIVDNPDSLTIPVSQLVTAGAIMMATTAGIALQRWRAGMAGGSVLLAALAGSLAVGSLDLVAAADGWSSVTHSGMIDSALASAQLVAIAAVATLAISTGRGEPRAGRILIVGTTIAALAFAATMVTPLDGRHVGGADGGRALYISGLVSVAALLIGGVACLLAGRRSLDVTRMWAGLLALVVGAVDVVALHASAVNDANFVAGLALFLVGVALVATGLHNDLVRLHAEQQAYLAEVEQAALAQLDELTAERLDREVIAHDGRSALLAIEGGLRYIEAHSDGEDLEQTRSVYRALTSELSRLRELLSGAAPGHPGPFLIREVIEPLARLHELNGSRIDIDVSPNAVAWADPAATREIMHNLLDNAREHAPHATVTISHRQDPASSIVVVADDGPGVPSSLRDAIFQQGVSSKPDTNAGLGLHASQSLAERMGGTLDVYSGPAGGAAFELSLPLARPVGPQGFESSDSTAVEVVNLREVHTA